MNKQSATIITIDNIRDLFKEYCEENRIPSSETQFREFLKFLEIDLYDWVKGNIRQFYSTKV